MLYHRYQSGIKDKLYNTFKADFEVKYKDETGTYDAEMYYRVSLMAALTSLSTGNGIKSVVTDQGQIAWETDVDVVAGIVTSLLIQNIGFDKVLQEKEHFITLASVIVNMAAETISIIQLYFEDESISNRNS